MPPSRTAVPAALTVLGLVLLAGCGGGDEPAAKASAPASSSSSSSASASPSPTTNPSADAKEAKSFCEGFDLAAIGRLAGGTVFRTEDPNGGCSFPQDDPKAPTIGITLVPDGIANGGLDSARRATTSAVTGDLTEVPAAGEGAFVVVGTFGSSQEPQAQGAVENDDDVVLVTVIQRAGLSAAKVRTIAEGALDLVASGTPGGSTA